MSNQAESIDRYTVAFQLNEALEAIAFTLREVERGDDTDPPMWVFLGDILDHLCLAWHQRRMGPDEVTKESQEEYELKAVSVPNWGGRFRLVEFVVSHPAIDFRLPRQKIDRETVCTYLRAAEVAVQAVMAQVESGRFDSCDISSLGDEFEPVLRNLCVAWHLRYLSGGEISSLDPAAVKELGSWLPPWEWNLRLIPLAEEA